MGSLTLTEFLSVEEVPTPPERKTAIWNVYGRRDTLGTVRWFGRWRCYAFFPTIGTIYNSDCLNALGQFCARRTQEHRALGGESGG